MHLICNLGSDALPLVVPGQGCLAMQAELNTAAPGVLGKIPVGRSATGRLGREVEWKEAGKESWRERWLQPAAPGN